VSCSATPAQSYSPCCCCCCCCQCCCSPLCVRRWSRCGVVLWLVGCLRERERDEGQHSDIRSGARTISRRTPTHIYTFTSIHTHIHTHTFTNNTCTFACIHNLKTSHCNTYILPTHSITCTYTHPHTHLHTATQVEARLPKLCRSLLMNVRGLLR
jgi:hypothetical protein